jgi:Cys-tRNA(Pro)/Cys-tRNA(Cys) deacylase
MASATKSPVEFVRELTTRIGFPCEIVEHEKSGKTSEQAASALGMDTSSILKSLLLRHGKGVVGAIIRGNDRLDVKKLEEASGTRNLKMASPGEIKSILRFEVGGVPPVIFYDRQVPTFVDRKVLEMAYVMGSAGTPNTGLGFNPIFLKEKLGYVVADITE